MDLPIYQEYMKSDEPQSKKLGEKKKKRSQGPLDEKSSSGNVTTDTIHRHKITMKMGSLAFHMLPSRHSHTPRVEYRMHAPEYPIN